ncbi:MAG: hypothetical protein AB7G37_14830 [Solirubrobacteraceae bacterium]
MTTPEEHQQEPVAGAPQAATTRDCERCGAGATADQEWCLGCGARMSPAVDRLPGLRAAAVTVAAAVLLAGGAAAAAYAALSNDASTTAQAPATASGTPVPQTTAAPVPPAVGTTPPAPAVTPPAGAEDDDTTALDDADADADDTTDLDTDTDTGADDADTDTSSSDSGSSGSSGGSSGSSSGSGSSGSSGGSSGSSGSGGGGSTTTTPSGPLTFGSGSLYDPDGVLADKGDDGAAIDGRTSTVWKFSLAAGKTGGFGYVLDFTSPTTVKTLTLRAATKGMVVKVLGTTKRDLPPDALDLGWDALTSETPISGSSTKLALKDAAGRTRKYRHVLVLVTTAPGTPAAGEIAEISGTS